MKLMSRELASGGENSRAGRAAPQHKRDSSFPKAGLRMTDRYKGWRKKRRRDAPRRPQDRTERRVIKTAENKENENDSDSTK